MFILGCFGSTRLNAQILFNNFGPGHSFDTNSGWTIGNGSAYDNAGYSQGLQFTPSLSGTLGTIEVALFSRSGSVVNASLMTDNNDQPGSLIEQFTFSGITGVAAIYSAPSVAKPTLTVGTYYWFVVTAPDPINDFFGWDRNLTATPALNAQRIGSNPWSINTDYQGTLELIAAYSNLRPVITTQPRSQIVSLGANPSLTVSATGTEPLSYRWTHNGTNLSDVGEFSGTATPTLAIDNVQAADAGDYTVVVSNAKGSVTSAKAVLTIGASIAVQVSQGGKVAPNYNGSILPVGKTYRMTATANAGCLFGGWSGSISTGTPILSFVLETNVVLEANFVPNPFLPRQGTYNGLFLDADTVTEASSGFFTLTLNKNGTFTGKILTSARSYNLPTTRPFGVGGKVEFTVATKEGDHLTFNLQLSDVAGQQITGTVSDGSWVAVLTADRASFDAKTNRAVNYEGSYTLAIAGSADVTYSPGGFGWGTLAVSPAGVLALKGNLADGTVLGQSVSLSQDGRWPFYAAYALPPTGNGGAVLGWIGFSNQPATALGGTLYWFRPEGKLPAVYQGGFTNLGLPVVGSTYNVANKPLLALTNAQVVFYGGNLPFSITNLVTLTSNDTIIVPIVEPENTNKLLLTITKPTGAMSGSFANPANPKQTIKLNGVLLQNQTNAAGYFLGTNESGAFLLEKQ